MNEKQSLTNSFSNSDRTGDAAACANARLLRLPDVMKTVGLRRASIYQYVREGRFPKPVRITERSVGWVEAEIQAWIAERIAQRPGVDTSIATVIKPVLTPSDPQPGYFVSAEEYSELQRLRRLEGRTQSLPQGVANSSYKSRNTPAGADSDRSDPERTRRGRRNFSQ